MLRIGLTGGIAAGKSVVAARLAERGAVLIDADRIAREVVEPGTEGLAEVVREFGTAVLAPDGSLDRAALGALVFGNEGRRLALNAIVHPLVRAEAARQVAAAEEDAVVVQDIPLLVETGQGAAFHLVVVVAAPEELRIERMAAHRAMTEVDARARIRAQASDEEREAAADVMLHNDGSVDGLRKEVDELWDSRLVPFARNMAAHLPAERTGPAILLPPDPRWPAAAARLAARLQAAAPESVLRVDHIGSTSVPGLAAKDVIDLQVSVRSLADADAVAARFTTAGFPRRPGEWHDEPRSSDPDPSHWLKRLHGSADPGRAANVHVRVAGSPGWRYALAFRDWLRSEPDARAGYEAMKRRVAAVHSADVGTAEYARDKEAWFNQVADPALQRWIRETGWEPAPVP